MQIRKLLRGFLLLFIAVMFLVDIYTMLTSPSNLSSSYHQRAINIAFRSAFGLFELIMIGIMVYFIVNYPSRRIRLLSLLFFHIAGVLVIPMGTRNFSFMALAFPWPQTLLPFAKTTPLMVFLASLIIGFILIPFITILWGRKAYCGYICPLGGFYSESLGRLFNPKPGKLPLLRRFGPPIWFAIMTLALLTILVFPSTLEQVRTVQKLLFFIFSQVLFFVVGIPFIGARSYCTHLCPLGFEIKWIVFFKRKFKKDRKASPAPAS